MAEQKQPEFLPISIEGGRKRYDDKSQEGKSYHNGNEKKFSQFDVVFITGDPYYDHPLNGVAILSRLLDKKGYRVGIVAQPQSDEDFKRCSVPKLFFCITSGLLDSMLANYTPMLRKREGALVPERAIIAYTHKIKELFKGSMTVIGGVEATIRRFSHYDYKDDKIRRGILHDSKADVLLFGNAERSLLSLANRVARGVEESYKFVSTTANGKHENEQNKNQNNNQNSKQKQDISLMHAEFDNIKKSLDLKTLDGAAFRVKKEEADPKAIDLPSFESCVKEKSEFSAHAKSVYLFPESSFIEQTGIGYVQHNKPSATLTEQEMDYVYSIGFKRQFHPATRQINHYEKMSQAFKNSVVIGRGCFGGCYFCIIPLVQGKQIAKRSNESIIAEIEALCKRGENHINDLTLPSINMYGSYCRLYSVPDEIYSPILERMIKMKVKKRVCNQQCMRCENRVVNDDLLQLLKALEKVKHRYNAKIELSSGIRHDLLLHQKGLFPEIIKYVNRLKVAPEHTSDRVLRQMNKGRRKDFVDFLEQFREINRKLGMQKKLECYFIAAHPGCDMQDMTELKKFCNERGLSVSLTQVFTPTAGTISTAMYHTGENPFSKKRLYTAWGFKDKKDQKGVMTGNLSKQDEDHLQRNG